MSVQTGDAVSLTRELVRVDSRNPALVAGAPGEVAVARTLAAVLRDWGFSVEVLEAAPGRPNVIARIGGGTGRGRGRGRSLMLNGHLDVVGVEGMVHPPFDAQEHDGRMYGRGASDMKGGVAAMCAAAARAAAAVGGGVLGEVVIAAVADEEHESIGTSALIASGLRTTAAIVTEPTRLAIAPAHKGFAWIEVAVHGRAAHGSRYDIGVDAIRHAGLLLSELDIFEETQLTRRTHPLLGHASLHASLIGGGIGISTYPDRCVIQFERRTLPGETAERAAEEIRAACARVRSRKPLFAADVSPGFSQAPSDVAPDAPIVRALSDAIAAAGSDVRLEGLSAWTDAALLNDAGVPAICYGPGDITLAHAAEEWVSVAEIEQATSVLTHLVTSWCSGEGDEPWRS